MTKTTANSAKNRAKIVLRESQMVVTSGNEFQKGAEWRDPKGKGPITYASLLTKKKFSGLSINDAEQAVAVFGWTIPASDYVVPAKSRGRPKKVVEVSDTDSEDGSKKKKRGRPKKKASPKARSI